MLSKDQLKALAIQLSAAMPPPLPQQVVVLATGETLPGQAIEIARVYAHASPTRRAAFDALAAAFRCTEDFGGSLTQNPFVRMDIVDAVIAQMPDRRDPA